MREFLAGGNPQAVRGVARERGRPLPRPADGHHDAAIRHLQVIVREPPVGRTTAVRRKALTGIRGENLGVRLIAFRRAGVALDAMQHELVALGALEACVQSLDVFKNRRVVLAAVLEINRPLDCRVVGVIHRDTLNHQSRFRIGPREGVSRAVGVELLALDFFRPLRQQLVRRLPAVDKGERQLGLLAEQMGFGPLVLLPHFLRLQRPGGRQAAGQKPGQCGDCRNTRTERIHHGSTWRQHISLPA